MKKLLLIPLILALLLSCGCAGRAEDRHPDWPKDWARVHPDLGVECPEGFTPGESRSVDSGLYFASWTTGDGREITNAEGKKGTVYDAQFYVLVMECASAQEAESTVADWTELEQKAYETAEMQDLRAAGQSYRLLPFTAPKEGSSYHHGAAAFTVCGATAISVELLCAEQWSGVAEDALEAFLNGFHYGFPDHQDSAS